MFIILCFVGMALMLCGLCMDDEDVGFGTVMIGAFIATLGTVFL
jgi:hypothetical protein